MPVDAFNDLLDKEIEKEYWIMDGNLTAPSRSGWNGATR
jgi:hypothetical protein